MRARLNAVQVPISPADRERFCDPAESIERIIECWLCTVGQGTPSLGLGRDYGGGGSGGGDSGWHSGGHGHGPGGLVHPGIGSIGWPLFSLQPSLNDAAFLRALVPFDEDPRANPPGAYWRFELQFALRFVRAGGRKVTLPYPTARPMLVASSST